MLLCRNTSSFTCTLREQLLEKQNAGWRHLPTCSGISEAATPARDVKEKISVSSDTKGQKDLQKLSCKQIFKLMCSRVLFVLMQPKDFERSQGFCHSELLCHMFHCCLALN